MKDSDVIENGNTFAMVIMEKTGFKSVGRSAITTADSTTVTYIGPTDCLCVSNQQVADAEVC